jgi:hypothetical protein
MSYSPRELAHIKLLFGNAAFKPRKPGTSVRVNPISRSDANKIVKIFGANAFKSRTPGTSLKYRKPGYSKDDLYLLPKKKSVIKKPLNLSKYKKLKAKPINWSDFLKMDAIRVNRKHRLLKHI